MTGPPRRLRLPPRDTRTRAPYGAIKTASWAARTIGRRANATRSTTRQLLVTGVEADRLICPASPGGVDETLAPETSWRDIFDLQDQLSMDVSFLDDRVIAQREVFDAAASFCGDGPFYSLADEAFDDDPHTPRDDLFPGGLRVRARFGPSELRTQK
jgi:hypothetical protein